MRGGGAEEDGLAVAAGGGGAVVARRRRAPTTEDPRRASAGWRAASAGLDRAAGLAAAAAATRAAAGVEAAVVIARVARVSPLEARRRQRDVAVVAAAITGNTFAELFRDAYAAYSYAIHSYLRMCFSHNFQRIPPHWRVSYMT
jgi:hypothetical protein